MAPGANSAEHWADVIANAAGMMRFLIEAHPDADVIAVLDLHQQNLRRDLQDLVKRAKREAVEGARNKAADLYRKAQQQRERGGREEAPYSLGFRHACEQILGELKGETK